MRLTIIYKPHTVTVPKWAEDDVRKFATSTRKADREALEELLDDISEHEGWYPAYADFDVVTPNRKKAVR